MAWKPLVVPAIRPAGCIRVHMQSWVRSRSATYMQRGLTNPPPPGHHMWEEVQLGHFSAREHMLFLLNVSVSVPRAQSGVSLFCLKNDVLLLNPWYMKERRSDCQILEDSEAFRTGDMPIRFGISQPTAFKPCQHLRSALLCWKKVFKLFSKPCWITYWSVCGVSPRHTGSCVECTDIQTWPSVKGYKYSCNEWQPVCEWELWVGKWKYNREKGSRLSHTMHQGWLLKPIFQANDLFSAWLNQWPLRARGTPTPLLSPV